MFKNILLAKRTGAKITGFHVAPTYKFHIDEEYVPPDFMLPNEYRERAKKLLSVISTSSAGWPNRQGSVSTVSSS
jgi:hypothetical protein